MKKIILFSFSVILFLAVIGHTQTKDLSISITPQNSVIIAGQNITYNITITNHQTSEDVLDIFISGTYPYLYRLSQNTVTIPAKGNRTIFLYAYPRADAISGSYVFEISAASKRDTERWVSSKAIIGIVNIMKQSNYHDQPPLLSLEQVGPGNIGLNFYINPKLTDRGYVIGNGGQCCVGSTIKLEDTALSGEWFSKGGPKDSPPVEWVDNLDAVKMQIALGTFKTTTYDSIICYWRVNQERLTGPERCVVDGSLICSHKCEFSSKGIEGDLKQGFKITNEGDIEINITCPIECIFFVDRQNKQYSRMPLSNVYGYMELMRPIQSLENKIMIKAVKGERGPDIDIIKSTIYPNSLKEGEKANIRLAIKNTGDMEAKIDNIELNLRNYEILYQPKSLIPGEESEIIIKARAEDVGYLKANMKYKSDHLGCLLTKDFKEEVTINRITITGKLQPCSTNNDCLFNEVCCERYCMDLSKGFCDDLNGDGIPETWISYY